MSLVRIKPHDPVVARDGRPFGAGEGGNRARSLDWIYPSVVAGAVRTVLGKALAGEAKRPFDDPQLVARVKRIAVAGPLLEVAEVLYLPAPRDFFAYREGERQLHLALRPRPLLDGEGVDLPPGLWPMEFTTNAKPAPSPSFWRVQDYARWLATDDPEGFAPADGHGLLPKEERVHVQIDPQTGRAEDGKLYTTQTLVFNDIPLERPDGRTRVVNAVARAEAAGDSEAASLLAGLAELHPFGGERRLAKLEGSPDESAWSCPEEIRKALARAGGVRLGLATPAIFAGGWRPGWLDRDSLEGTLPGSGVRVRLKGACVDRWRPLSGWNLEKGRRGPKPIRRLVPAGAVYFFELCDGAGSGSALADWWLHPVSDEEQDRRDGFGLATYGVWERRSGEGRN
ncbi:MAG: type III-B CRISPR module-associated protein Cmr3 [Bacillota bacterium]|nr:type III-B CRISPR module-associated protein Cmr3 [Bacillota bacterium]